MAFGTWLKNLITKGKALIKKAAPTIRKGIEIAKKFARVIGGAVGSVINGIAKVIDRGMNKITNDTPKKPLTFNFSDSDIDEDSNASYESSNSDPKIMERRVRIGDNGNGRLRPVLKQLH